MFTSREIWQLATNVQNIAEENEKMRKELIGLDQWYELACTNLQYASDYLEAGQTTQYQQTKQRLQADLDYHRKQQQNLTRLLAFRKKELQAAEAERESELQHLGFSYQYLRSQWVHYRKVNGQGQLDDRMDRLNKMVAAIRSKTQQKMADVVSDNCFRSQVLKEEEAWDQLQRRLGSVCMQREDLLGRLQRSQDAHASTSQENKRLSVELGKVKDKLKNIENKYFQSCKKNLELEETINSLGKELNKFKRQEKMVYVNPIEDWTIEIHGQFIEKSHRQSTVTLEKVKALQQEVSSQQNLQEDTSRLTSVQSEKVLEAIRIFPSNLSIHPTDSPVMTKLPPKTTTNIREPRQPTVADPNNKPNTSERRPLSRQASQGNLRPGQAGKSILKRTPNHTVASVAKLAYIRQPSREKVTEIEKSFYVRFEHMG